MLITGASGGLGVAIARSFCDRGCELVLTSRGGPALERLGAELGAETVGADLAKRGDLRKLLKAVGRVDVLVANAALPAAGELDSFNVTEIDRALDVNLRAPIVLARELAGPMVERGSGHVVVLSSLSSKFITPGSSLYCTTKAGLRAFAAGLRQDLEGTGVGVSAVLPGPISDAGMWADGGAAPPAGIATRTPDDVARAILSAIEHDRGEVDVAAPLARLGSALAQLSPALAERINGQFGTRQLAQQVSVAHAGNR